VKMKKLLTLLLAVGFSLAFVACGNQAKEEAATEATEEMTEATEEMTEEAPAEEAPAEEMTEEADSTEVVSE
jgi:ABC-type enterochelin transport system substrate-binding protein